MTLEVQIQSMIYSLVYGLFFSFLLNLNYRLLFTSKKIIQIIFNFFFIIDNVLLYFILLKYINHGIIHLYFIFLIIIGFLIGNQVTKKIRFRKWFFKTQKINSSRDR